MRREGGRPHLRSRSAPEYRHGRQFLSEGEGRLRLWRWGRGGFGNGSIDLFKVFAILIGTPAAIDTLVVFTDPENVTSRSLKSFKQIWRGGYQTGVGFGCQSATSLS